MCVYTYAHVLKRIPLSVCIVSIDFFCMYLYIWLYQSCELKVQWEVLVQVKLH